MEGFLSVEGDSRRGTIPCQTEHRTHLVITLTAVLRSVDLSFDIPVI